MMPRQHIGSPVAHGDTGAKGSDGSVSCKDGGVLPITGFPHVGGKVKEERARNNSDTVQPRASHTSHNIRSRASSWGYTFVACIIGAVRVRSGVGEVDVLGTFGSGSRGTRRLVKNHGGGSCHTL